MKIVGSKKRILYKFSSSLASSEDLCGALFTIAVKLGSFRSCLECNVSSLLFSLLQKSSSPRMSPNFDFCQNAYQNVWAGQERDSAQNGPDFSTQRQNLLCQDRRFSHFYQMALGTGTTGSGSPAFLLLLLVLNTILIFVSCGPFVPLAISAATGQEGDIRLEEQITSVGNMDVGGGAINEKQRNFPQQGAASYPSSYDPVHTWSHLQHSLEGLDRFPNYLSRYSLEQMDSLEQALLQRLELVRVQRTKITRQRDKISQVVSKVLLDDKHFTTLVEGPTTWDEVGSVLDPRALNCINRFRKLNASPSLQDILSGKVQVELDAGYLEQLMDEVVYDVYSLPLIAPEFCKTLQRYLRAVNAQLEIKSRQNSDDVSTTLGIRDLDRIGLSWLNDLLFHLIIKPISRHLFKESETSGGELDWRQGYVAAYSASPSQTRPRQRLVPHTDDSEVTLNVCVGDDFSGGNLRFRDLRGATPGAGRDLLGEYKPEIGRAIIHAGRHFHEVTEVTSGDRFAYIIWARSWSGVRAVTCPCCWLNRRTDSSCICGPRWN
jgi:hypothetical protein